MSTLLFILSTIISLGGNPFAEECQVYPMSAIVTEIDEENDFVVFTSYDGNEWEYDDCDDWEIGDDVVMMMYNNMTIKNRYDDVILTVKYEYKE